MKNLKAIFLLTFLIGWALITSSCQKVDVEPDPAKAILGKWEIIEMGNWPNMEPVVNPVAYSEYLVDSVLRECDYEKQTYFTKKYWIDDSLLYEGIYRENGYLLTIRYRYEFFDKNNKLRLDLQALGIYNSFIYKRIE
ncbi:hypothetical protein [Echinicola salinicaeni]|uniref:hypothetical protein n=1 Tax=Echinicola salinicaeni TaxID=2762757 RepID=UPI001645C93C|nr:hypothetical protein [Echinicola salinicaeni]